MGRAILLAIIQPGGLQAAAGELWSADWAWGLPLIVLTVVLHVLCLGLINQRVLRTSGGMLQHPHRYTAFVVVTGVTTMLATGLHGIEAMWAAAYRLVDAVPDSRSAMLYSLNAITSYGHTTLVLEPRWQLMGALEALNGWLLFGLTTAFLFSVIDKIWLLGVRETSEPARGAARAATLVR
jgi:hypothetical protein